MSIMSCSCMGNKQNKDPSECHCNEENDALSWRWCTKDSFQSALLSKNALEILFHQRYSSGTATIRGDTPFEPNNHYYWEVKILSRLYGTDVMVGIGTPDVEVEESRYKFYSLLGRDANSWGFSYKGTIQHAGKTYGYGPPYSIGDTVGVHLDMWHGTVEFYLNRKSLGIAFTGLKCHKVLYPMVCSTAAQSIVKLVYAVCEPASLMLHCVRFLSHQPATLEMMRSIPGLKNKFKEHFWLLLPSLSIPISMKDEDDNNTVCSGKMFKSSSNFGMRSAASKTNRNSTQSVYDGGTSAKLKTPIEPHFRLQNSMDTAGHQAVPWGEFADTNIRMPAIITSEEESSIVYGDLSNDDDECSEEELPKSFHGPNNIDTDTRSPSTQCNSLTAGFSSPLCQICNLRPAVSLTSLQMDARKCLQCFYKT